MGLFKILDSPIYNNRKIKFCMKKYVGFSIMLFFISCSNGENRELNEKFPRMIRLKAEKIEIKEIIKPGLILLLDNYLIVQNEYNHSEDCFFVYSLEPFKFLYSFGRLGQGPDEYIAHRLIQNSNGNVLSVFDQSSRYIHNFHITDTEPVLIEKNRIEDNRREPFQELSYLNDSIILLLKYDYTLCSYNINEKIFLDEFNFETDIKKKLGENYKLSLETYHFSNYKDKIVIGHNYINTLSAGKIENNKFIINNKKLTSSGVNQSLYKNSLYYLYTTTTSEHIFAQYYGLPFIQLQPFPINMKKRNFNFYIEVYDWNLNPLVLLEFDSDILRCAIDEKNKTIYTWNPLEDFDYLLVYKYDI